MVRAARARQIHARSVQVITSKRRQTVELLSAIGDVVGMATTELALGSGMELHGLKLFPYEVAVHITRVDDASHWTGEVIGERLGLCMDLIIRWNRSFLRVVAIEPNILNALGEDVSQTSPTQTMAPVFDFHERFNTSPSTERSRRSSLASNPVDENLPFSQGTPSNIRDLPHVDGLAYVRPTRRPYSMQNRRRRDSNETTLTGTTPTKVSLANVQRAIAQGGCKRNCLRGISARYLLDMRYNAWASKFSTRSTWMRQMLVSFYTRTEKNSPR